MQISNAPKRGVRVENYPSAQEFGVGAYLTKANTGEKVQLNLNKKNIKGVTKIGE